MPELPEVETIAHALRDGGSNYQTSVIGQEVQSALVLWPRSLAMPSKEEFVRRIRRKLNTGVSRRGKYLNFSLSEESLLFFHLRMSGNLRLEPAEGASGTPKPFKKHDRLVLIFTNGMRLVFNDPRKFGRIWLTNQAEEVIGELGPEPLDEELTADRFYRMLKGRKRQLKPLLMDQTFLAGLGNIYTDEALHLAKLHPLTKSSDLNKMEAARLLEAIQAVLSEGIQRNGASIDWVYQGGEFQNNFRVYGRKGKPCPACGTAIERLVVSQRGTYICPNCQKVRGC